MNYRVIIVFAVVLLCTAGCSSVDQVPGDSATETPKTSGKRVTQDTETKSSSSDIDQKDASDAVSEKEDDSSKDGIAGKYLFRLPQYQGVLHLYEVDGTMRGTITFTNWGKGIAEPMKNLKINKGKIYFERSVTTPEEKQRLGVSRYFKQEFYGIFTEDGLKITGKYVDSGAEAPWSAVKK